MEREKLSFDHFKSFFAGCINNYDEQDKEYDREVAYDASRHGFPSMVILGKKDWCFLTDMDWSQRAIPRHLVLLSACICLISGSAPFRPNLVLLTISDSIINDNLFSSHSLPERSEYEVDNEETTSPTTLLFKTILLKERQKPTRKIRH